MFKKIIFGIGVLCILFLVSACGRDNPAPSTKMTGKITVMTREEGSGTRGAFVEIFGVVDGNGDDIIPVIFNHRLVQTDFIRSDFDRIDFRERQFLVRGVANDVVNCQAKPIFAKARRQKPPRHLVIFDLPYIGKVGDIVHGDAGIL